MSLPNLPTISLLNVLTSVYVYLPNVLTIYIFLTFQLYLFLTYPLHILLPNVPFISLPNVTSMPSFFIFIFLHFCFIPYYLISFSSSSIPPSLSSVQYLSHWLPSPPPCHPSSNSPIGFHPPPIFRVTVLHYSFHSPP